MKRKLLILAVFMGLLLLCLAATAEVKTEVGGFTFTATDYTCEYCGYEGEIGDCVKYPAAYISVRDFSQNTYKITFRLGCDFHCNGCNYGINRGISAITITSKNSCTEPFYQVLRVEDFYNLKYTITAPAIGHCPKEAITCKRKGVCTRCNEVYGDVADHAYINYKETKPFNCQENAQETGSCKWCGVTNTREIPNTAKHVFEVYVSDDNATCQTNCTQTAQCIWKDELGCTETHTVEIANTKADHKMAEYVSNNDATCQTNCTQTRVCVWKDLGCGYSETEEIPDSKVDHADGEEAWYKEPKCTEDGTKLISCKWKELGCTYTYKKKIADSRLGHSFRYVWKELSCTQDEGNMAVCRRCSYSFMSDIETEAPGHYFGEWKYAKDAEHKAACVHEGCTLIAKKPCVLFEITDGETVKTFCPVCGNFDDRSWTVLHGVVLKEVDEDALPAKGEKLIRALNAPVEGALYGFTVSYEWYGEIVPFNGKVSVEMKVSDKVTEKFCLVRVDVTPETEEAPRTENWENVDFTCENGVLKFETDKAAVYLLLPAAR